MNVTQHIETEPPQPGRVATTGSMRRRKVPGTELAAVPHIVHAESPTERRRGSLHDHPTPAGGSSATTGAAKAPAARAGDGGAGGHHDNHEALAADSVAYFELAGLLRRLVLPVFSGRNERRRQAALWFWGCVALLVLEGFVHVKFSDAQKDFTDAMSGRDEPAFWVAITKFSYLLVALSVLYATAVFAEHTAVCELRTYLTGTCLDAYLANPVNPLAYYHVAHYADGAIDNPGQRIVDDARHCSEEVVHLVGILVEKAIKVVSFVYVLYTISPGLVGFAVVYALSGTIVSSYLFGRILGGVQNASLKYEATLRHALIYIQQYAEEIAFYNGARGERARAAAHYDNILHAHHVQTSLDARIECFTKAFSFLTVLLPYVVLAQQFFAGDVTFGQVTQTGSAFYHIRQGMGIMVSKVHMFSETAIHLKRLSSLLGAIEAPPRQGIARHVKHINARDTTPVKRASSMKKLKAKDAGEDAPGDGTSSPERAGSRIFSQARQKHARIAAALRVEGLTVQLGTPPHARMLINNLTFSLECGMRVLVTGPNGCGKTTLLRAMFGLAPLGVGDVYVPSDMFVLPQRLYAPEGNLRAQLQYPRTGADPEHDRVLLQMLMEVGLGALHAAVGGLDGGADVDFRTRLSPGEQQRVGFVRLLSARPSLALLDEATCAVDEGTEAVLYHLLHAAVPSYMSVGHRSSLFKYHTHVLYPHDLGAAEWRMVPTAEYLAAHADDLSL